MCRKASCVRSPSDGAPYNGTTLIPSKKAIPATIGARMLFTLMGSTPREKLFLYLRVEIGMKRSATTISGCKNAFKFWKK